MTLIVAALSYFPATLSWHMKHIVGILSGYLATLSCTLQYSLLLLWPTFLLLGAETFDGLKWDIKYKLSTSRIGSSSQNFSWISQCLLIRLISDTYHICLVLNSRNLNREKKNQYLPTTSTSHKLARGKLNDSILLEFELTGLWLVLGKRRLKYASLRNDFNEPFEIWIIYFVTKS